jgi:hypothetical protein
LLAAGDYHKVSCFDRTIDAGLRILQSLMSSIIANKEKDQIRTKASDLFEIVQKLGMRRKAFLVCSSVSKRSSGFSNSGVGFDFEKWFVGEFGAIEKFVLCNAWKDHK